jgi:hypothetical protein
MEMIKMRKIMAVLFVLFLMSPMVLAQGQQGIHEPGTGRAMENATPGEIAAAQAGELIAVQLRKQLRMQTPEGVREIIQERRQLMQQEVEAIQSRARQRAFQNQNEVRMAVHGLLDMETLVGGIGPQVREVARNFNNSIQATINSEERIQARGRFRRLFVGGDEEAAAEIEERVSQNQARIQQLNQLREQCNCSEEVKAMMQERIQLMQQEQERLRELAQNEKQSRGIIGWMWK